MSHPVRILETSTHVAPLGVRFWDAAAATTITGLELTLAPVDDPTREVRAVQNRAGIYVAQHLPGLREAERGAGDATYWQAPPASGLFLATVRDPAGRFLPASFELLAPQRGVLRAACEQSPVTPAQGPPGVTLFSAPTRTAPAGAAVVRAQLFDALAERPAAWAVVEARLDGALLGRGMADEQGNLALLFPYPPRPISGTRPPLREQTWSIDLSAHYLAPDPVPRVPDLCAALSQPSARLWADSARAASLTGALLRYGEELILRSVGPGGARLAELHITAP